MGNNAESWLGQIDFNLFNETQFEEFCFELLQHVGFVNVDWRKGTNLSSSPSDSGRDIVANLEREDFDGTKRLETWFVDCKHQQKGVPPKELQNLLSWANAERPTVALFIVSGFLSNPSKDYLRDYELNNRPPFLIKYCERPVLERLATGNENFLRRFFGDLPRSYSEILATEEEFFDRVWYDRNRLLEKLIKEGKKTVSEDVATGMKIARIQVEKKYGADKLGPYDDFEWGMINGKLSALRWVMGEDWDMLDT
ncbi:MAG: restriction endonuclease [Desulforudis sp.]|jgi:hypothetical protein|nr:MAG: restriction endonuclease [Desulforudis sp.]